MGYNDKTNTIPVVESDGKEPSLKLMDIVQDILDIEKRILDIKKKMKELMIQNNEEEPKQKEIDKDFFERETS